MRNPDSPEFSLSALLSIIDEGGPETGRRQPDQDRLEALKEWRDALLRRDELARRLASLEQADAGEAPGAEPAAKVVAEPLPARSTGPPDVPAARRVASPLRLPQLIGERQDTAGLDLTRLARAREVSQVGSAPPEFLYYGRVKRFLARMAARPVLFLAGIVTAHQRIFNTALVEFAAESGTKLGELGTRLDQMEQNTHRLADAIGAAISEREAWTADGIRQLFSRLQGLHSAVQEEIAQLQSQLQSQSRLQGQLQARLAESDVRSLEQEHRLAGIECDRAWLRLARVEQGEVRGDLQRRFGALEEDLASLREVETRHAAETEARHSEAVEDLVRRLEHLEIRARDADALEQRRQDLEAQAGQMRSAVPASPATGHLSRELDAFYINLENQFRGSRELIKQRLEEHLPLLTGATLGTADRPVLDLGCGRGEWLELLAEHGLVARGVEINEVAASNCRELGLDVTTGDALSHLRDLPSGQLGMLTAFHVLEHVPFEYMIALFDESLRVLQPGGMVLLETPNPENIVVASTSFHCDPTHRRPIHPEVLVFSLRQRGFVQLDLRRPTESRPNHRLPEPDDGDELTKRLHPIIALLNKHLAASADFAVIGRKPS